MHRWTLTSLLALSAGIAAWLAPTTSSPPPAGTSGGPAPLAGPSRGRPAAVDGPLTLDVALDQGAAELGGVARRYLVVTVEAPREAAVARLPVDLALVMDVSGSMAGDGKMSEARRAAAALVDALGPEDNFALVSFSDRARVERSLGHHPHGVLHDLVASLHPDGGTNLSGGLDAGFSELMGGSSAVRRVILMTDGQANQGTTHPQQLARLAKHPSATVSTVGFGYDFNESLLASMADAGGGRYRYVDARTDLAGAYTQELEDAAHLVASGARVVVDLPDGVTAQRVFQWEAAFDPHAVTVQLGDLAAGQSRTVVIEVDVPVEALGAAEVATVRLEGVGLPDRASFRELETARLEGVAFGTALAPWTDKAAMTAATRAVAGWSALAANAAYQQGDVERGRNLLREAAGFMTRQQRANDLAIPEAEIHSLEQLGYLDQPAAQKESFSAARALGRGE